MNPEYRKPYHTPKDVLDYTKSENPKSIFCAFAREGGDISVLCDKYDRKLFLTAFFGMKKMIKEKDKEIYKELFHE